MPRILVVDDDELVSSAIRTWLERQGHTIVVAEDGIAGLNALDGATFDLMIIDIFMPHMRGFESRFPENGPGPRRLALSSQTVHTGDVAGCDRRVPAGSAGCSERRCLSFAMITARAVITAADTGAIAAF
jgi:Response regulator receiver domain